MKRYPSRAHLQLIVLAFAIPLSLLLSGCEACSKKMTVSGKVTDSSGTALSGVNVYCCIVRDMSTPRMTTGDDGTYSFTDENLGGFKDATVRFEKSGYVIQKSAPFTEEEAGIDRCGEYGIERNITLASQ